MPGYGNVAAATIEMVFMLFLNASSMVRTQHVQRCELSADPCQDRVRTTSPELHRKDAVPESVDLWKAANVASVPLCWSRNRQLSSNTFTCTWNKQYAWGDIAFDSYADNHGINDPTIALTKKECQACVKHTVQSQFRMEECKYSPLY